MSISNNCNSHCGLQRMSKLNSSTTSCSDHNSPVLLNRCTKSTNESFPNLESSNDLTDFIVTDEWNASLAECQNSHTIPTSNGVFEKPNPHLNEINWGLESVLDGMRGFGPLISDTLHTAENSDWSNPIQVAVTFPKVNQQAKCEEHKFRVAIPNKIRMAFFGKWRSSYLERFRTLTSILNYFAVLWKRS